MPVSLTLGCISHTMDTPPLKKMKKHGFKSIKRSRKVIRKSLNPRSLDLPMDPDKARSLGLSRTFLIKPSDGSPDKRVEIMTTTQVAMGSSTRVVDSVPRRETIRLAMKSQLRRASMQGSPTACQLCGAEVVFGGMLSHKQIVHGEAAVPPKTKRRRVKYKFSGFLSGGLPSLGKNSR